MNRLALVIIARNEERCIGRCLSSAAPYVDEMIVVDTGSNDRTPQIAAEHGAVVASYQWNDHFADARNFALSQTDAEWRLVLDADEYITSFDIEALRAFMEQNSPPCVGRIELASDMEQNGESSTAIARLPRLLPKGAQYYGRIHEQVDQAYSRQNVAIRVRHDGYLRTDKSARNIPLLLQELEVNKQNPYYAYQLAKEYDGTGQNEKAAGYFNMAYSLLTGKERYAPNVVVDYIYTLMKLGQMDHILSLIHKKHAWLEPFPDYHFACGVFYLEAAMAAPAQAAAYLPLIEVSYKRCLALGESSIYDTVEGTGSFAALYNLGVFYEVLGQNGKAMDCYKESAKLGYKKAVERLAAYKI